MRMRPAPVADVDPLDCHTRARENCVGKRLRLTREREH